MLFVNIAFIIIVISQIVAYMIIFMEDNVMNGNLIAIVIALIGVAGGIWTQVVQFKKDSQRIEGVNSTAGNVKNDTSEMRPKIENIDRNCNIIRDDIIRTVLPQMNVVTIMQSGIQELIEEKHHNDKIKENVSSTAGNPAYIINSVNMVYERNASLEIERTQLISEKIHLQAQIQALQNENRVLCQQLNEMKAEKQIDGKAVEISR